jgi:hypothetical protein
MEEWKNEGESEKSIRIRPRHDAARSSGFSDEEGEVLAGMS